MQVFLDSSFARPGSAPIWGGKKGEFRDWTKFHRKLINNNFVPRFPIPSPAPWMCKLWVRSLPAGTWRTKHRESLGFNNIFEDAVISVSSAIVMICLELI